MEHSILYKLGGTEKKGELRHLAQLHRTCNTAKTPEGATDYELLTKGMANPSNLELKCINSEKLHLQKRFEKIPESLAKMIGEGLFLYKGNLLW